MLKQMSLSLGLCLSLGGFLSAQDTAATVQKAVVERMKTDIFYLAGPECEGRGVETQGINKAADYIANSFKSFGLKPGLPDGSYFQPFKIGGSYKQSAPSTVKITGPGGKELSMTNVNFSVAGMSGPGKIQPTDIVFVGYGISRDEKYDDYAGVDVAGKVVVVMRRTPMYEKKDTPFPQMLAALTNKVTTAENHKAALIAFVNNKESGGENDELINYADARGATPSDIPVIHLKRSTVDAFLAGSGKTLSQIEDKIEKELKPVSFAVKDWKLEATVPLEVVRAPIAVKNVIGVLEGAGPLANETVVIGAHYDHLGRGEPGSLMRGSKDIHWGADDNGSGTTSVIELARRFGAMKDRQGRRMVFMTFSGEERGLLGSAHYCKHPIFPLKDTVAMINLDMVGRLSGIDGKNKLEIGGVGTAKEFAGLISKLNEKYKFPIQTTSTGNGPSDHQSFNQKNVPVFFFFTGLHAEYHRPLDKPELINLEGMKKICDMVEDLAKELTTEKDRPVYIQVGGSFNVQGNSRGPSIGLIPDAKAYDDAADNGGVPVEGARKDSPAEKAGLRQGDLIVEVAGKPVKNITAYMGEMNKAKRGEPLEITVSRDGKKVILKVELPK